MTHTTDKLREEFDEKFPPKFWNWSAGARELILDFFISKLETTLKDRESAGRVTKINGKTYVEINGVVDEIEIISNAQVHRLSLQTDTNSENK